MRRLRRWLPPVIVLFVVAFQAWQAITLVGQPAWIRFAVGTLVYGIVGPLTTHWTLRWIDERITRQAEIEERARRRERILATITSSSADAILGLDTGQIIRSWNRGARETLGYTPEEIVGKHIRSVMPRRLQPHQDDDRIQRRLRDRGFLRGVQARCRHKDGRTVSVDLTQTLLRGDDGQVIGSSLILRDMTSRIEAERAIMKLNRELEARVADRTERLQEATRELRHKNEELRRANAELEELDALKDEFVALVSHELRSPLTNIRASSELLLANRPADQQREKLQIIGQEAARLTRLVRSILDISRMQAGQFEVALEPVASRELIEQAVERLPAESGDRVRIQLPEEPPWALADAERIAEVLGNLLDNAIGYSPADSPIDVTIADAPDQMVRFRVTDRGIGIPPDQLDQIFERFHRVERGDARETYGHGLGLYIARKIVEAHGGTIGVESVPGRGATFEFALPSVPEEE